VKRQAHSSDRLPFFFGPALRHAHLPGLLAATDTTRSRKFDAACNLSRLTGNSVKTEMTEEPEPLTPLAERFILHWGEMGTRWGINRTVAQIHALL